MCFQAVYRARRSRRVAFLAAAAIVALSAAGARADIDPASDVLLNDNVFAYWRDICPQLTRPLVKLTEQAEKAGYPIKVAVIASEADLGGAPQYSGEPQEYTEFLAAELGVSSAHGTLRPGTSLLTVMPDGFGFKASGKSPDVSGAVDGLGKPKSDQPNDLARAAIEAVQKLALAAHRPLPAPDISGSDCSSGGGSSVLVYLLPIGLLLMAGIAVLAGRRRAS